MLAMDECHIGDVSERVYTGMTTTLMRMEKVYHVLSCGTDSEWVSLHDQRWRSRLQLIDRRRRGTCVIIKHEIHQAKYATPLTREGWRHNRNSRLRKKKLHLGVRHFRVNSSTTCTSGRMLWTGARNGGGRGSGEVHYLHAMYEWFGTECTALTTCPKPNRSKWAHMRLWQDAPCCPPRILSAVLRRNCICHAWHAREMHHPQTSRLSSPNQLREPLVEEKSYSSMRTALGQCRFGTACSNIEPKPSALVSASPSRTTLCL